MENVAHIMKKHNQQIFSRKEKPKPSCNCKNKNKCPMNGKFQVQNVVYKCTVSAHPTSQHEYISVLQRVIGSKDFRTTKSRSRTKVIEMTLHFQAIYGTLETQRFSNLNMVCR